MVDWFFKFIFIFLVICNFLVIVIGYFLNSLIIYILYIL